jgi:cell division protein ZapA
VETVTVNIFNSEYKLRGDNAERIQKAAGIVNEQMNYVSSKAPMQPAATTAVLAALNVAEQLLAAQDRAEERSTETKDRLQDLDQKLRELASST